MSKTQISAVIGTVIGLLFLFLIGPAVGFMIGWLGGFLVELFLGDLPANWLNHLLGTDRFIKGDLARITAFLAVVGSYIRTTVKEKSE